jgi:CRP-like cAMP-binding protein
MPSTLAALPLFNELHPADLERLVAVMSPQAFRRSERVIGSADGRSHVFVLAQGRLRVCSVTSGGREVTLHRFCSGSVLGLANLVSALPPAVDAFAETDGVLLRAPAREVVTLMGCIPRLGLVLLREALRQLHDAEEFARRLSQSSVERRVAAALLELAIPPEGAPTSREHLASRAAASRESVSRTLQRLAGQGVLELTGRRVRLRDEEALRRLACPSDGVPCYGGADDERMPPGMCTPERPRPGGAVLGALPGAVSRASAMRPTV